MPFPAFVSTATEMEKASALDSQPTLSMNLATTESSVVLRM